MNENERNAILDALDGDQTKIDVDGVLWRLRIETDEDTSINDEDTYGKVEYVVCDRNTGRPLPRPKGFTGRARKLTTYRGDAFWWEPPYWEGQDWDAETWCKETQHVRDLMTWGFKVAILERCQGKDAYRRPIVTHFHALAGVDTIDPEYLRQTVDELLAEIEYDLSHS